MGKLFQFFQDVRSEGAKVTWPTRKETAITTAMVFVMVVLASIFFLLADMVIRWGVTLILGIGRSSPRHRRDEMSLSATSAARPTRWYIVHAFSNFERKVADDIKKGAQQRGLDHSCEESLVPTEKVTELRRGRRIETDRKFFPGYV
ncbi:MAG: preprotein translocase subunit SecE, partial [Methylobacterium sp.]